MILFLTLKTFSTLYTLTSVCIFSILFTHLSKEAGKENLFNCQELLKLVIISSILTTSMFDSGGGYSKEKLDVGHPKGAKVLILYFFVYIILKAGYHKSLLL